MSQSLLDVVSRLIRERPRKILYSHITEATGVSTAKLNRMAHLKDRGFNVDDVQAVYEHLTNSKLVPSLYSMPTGSGT